MDLQAAADAVTAQVIYVRGAAMEAAGREHAKTIENLLALKEDLLRVLSSMEMNTQDGAFNAIVKEAIRMGVPDNVIAHTVTFRMRPIGPDYHSVTLHPDRQFVVPEEVLRLVARAFRQVMTDANNAHYGIQYCVGDMYRFLSTRVFPGIRINQPCFDMEIQFPLADAEWWQLAAKFMATHLSQRFMAHRRPEDRSECNGGSNGENRPEKDDIVLHEAIRCCVVVALVMKELPKGNATATVRPRKQDLSDAARMDFSVLSGGRAAGLSPQSMATLQEGGIIFEDVESYDYMETIPTIIDKRIHFVYSTVIQNAWGKAVGALEDIRQGYFERFSGLMEFMGVMHGVRELLGGAVTPTENHEEAAVAYVCHALWTCSSSPSENTWRNYVRPWDKQWWVLALNHLVDTRVRWNNKADELLLTAIEVCKRVIVLKGG